MRLQRAPLAISVRVSALKFSLFLTVLMGKPQKVQKPLQNKQLRANKSSTH